jgi:hypothetical protein
VWQPCQRHGPKDKGCQKLQAPQSSGTNCPSVAGSPCHNHKIYETCRPTCIEPMCWARVLALQTEPLREPPDLHLPSLSTANQHVYARCKSLLKPPISRQSAGLSTAPHQSYTAVCTCSHAEPQGSNTLCRCAKLLQLVQDQPKVSTEMDSSLHSRVCPSQASKLLTGAAKYAAERVFGHKSG